MTSHRSGRASRRRKIGATIAAVAVIGVAGGYGTYSAFSDTTELDGTASAGTIQLNDQGADSRSFTVSGLVPGDAPSICFVVAAPTGGNTQAQSVTLASSSTTQVASPPAATPEAATANASLAGDLRISLDRVDGADGTYDPPNGLDGGARTLNPADPPCTLTGTPVTSIAAQSVTGIAALTDSFDLDPGTKVTYKLTVALPSGAADASQGGSASFKLKWTGSAGT